MSSSSCSPQRIWTRLIQYNIRNMVSNLDQIGTDNLASAGEAQYPETPQLPEFQSASTTPQFRSEILQIPRSVFDSPALLPLPVDEVIPQAPVEETWMEVRARLKAAKIGHRKYLRVTMKENLLPLDKADINYEGQEDLSSEFGQKFYPHGFRRIGEKVQDAVRRWFKYYEHEAGVYKGVLAEKADTLAKSFINTMNENISRNLYTAFLHDLYAQRLRGYVNMIVVPLIFLNSFSSALGAISLMSMPDTVQQVFNVATTLLNLIAAILVAVQKFFMFEEKAALHEAIKNEYFDVISEENFLVLDLNVDPESGLVSTALGEGLSGQEIKSRLKKLSEMQKKLEGVPDEPVPEVVANELQPYVRNLQKKDGYLGRGLAGFPAVLGLKSYFLEVPPMTGCCAIVMDGRLVYQLGRGCPPVNHVVSNEGCEMHCCGRPFWHQGFKSVRKKKLSAAGLKIEDAKRIQAKKDEMHLERKKNRKTLQLMRKAQAEAGVQLQLPPNLQKLMGGEMMGPELVQADSGSNFPGMHSRSRSGSFPGIPPGLQAAGPSRMFGAGGGVALPEQLIPSRPLTTPSPFGPSAAGSGGTLMVPPLIPGGGPAASLRPLTTGSIGAAGTFGGLPRAVAESMMMREPVGMPGSCPESVVGRPPLPPGMIARPLGEGREDLAAHIVQLDGSDGQELEDLETPLMLSPSQPHSVGRSEWPLTPGSTASGLSPHIHSSGHYSTYEPPFTVEPGPLGEATLGEDEDEDFEESYGEEYYPPGFKLPGEKVYEAIWRWWESCHDDDRDAYVARKQIRQMADKGKAFMQTMTEAMSRNLYRALLNDAYAQILKQRANYIAVPLILMNALNASLSATTVTSLPKTVSTALTLTAVGLNVVSAVLVAVQKFYKFAERAALHEAIKKGYFDAYNSETDLVIDLTMDPGTKTFITTSEDGVVKQLDFEDMMKKLKKLMNIEQKASGIPEEAVPQEMARKLQPYVSKMQKEGYTDRMHLFSFPPVLGVQSYFLEVPESTGCCSIVTDGAITWECGHGCKPIEHDLTEEGCELLCCGGPCVVCADRLRREEETPLLKEQREQLEEEEKVRDVALLNALMAEDKQRDDDQAGEDAPFEGGEEQKQGASHQNGQHEDHSSIPVYKMPPVVEPGMRRNNRVYPR
ncbi:hypothetical protein CEUSTIGMA_g9388.t1 [Chlamydomonas eustigma]|uniref:Uncharacterized protein n=1 Tax=Chlamydomonas eustigma TaxID=1157962 RepID=A0A250XGP7_9CHLO|nr:hypothetical protein CEUSTIGMA_g9388.t1 [Chlamydomonas eustigma]|eukprot:GAX81960.1 hypothetical protein CEUSTIGMA_g9388.t1 [Chlamydomonas eustigma]